LISPYPSPSAENVGPSMGHLATALRLGTALNSGFGACPRGARIFGIGGLGDQATKFTGFP